MKKVGLFALITLALLIALVAYSLMILGEYEDLEKELSDDYHAAAKTLQVLDARFPDPKSKTIDPARWTPWIEARTDLAQLLAERFRDPDKVTSFQLRRTRNLALQRLGEALDQRSMGISEYCAIAARWRAILARPEFRDLQAHWKKTVRTQSNPEGLELPDPAADATPAELALIKENVDPLRATMDADKLSILLDRIAGGEIPDPAKKKDS